MLSKREFILIGVIVGLLVYVFGFNNSEIIEVVVPSKENVFNVENPVPDKRIDTVEVEVFVKGKKVIQEKIVEVENPLNKELLEKYEKALFDNDSLKQLHIFKEAIRERKYTEVLEDSIQVITVKSDVIGTLKRQTVSYKTKEVILKVDVGKKDNDFYIGGFSKVPTIQGEEVSIGLKIDLKNSKNLFSAGFDNQKNVYIGYSLKLF